MPNLNLIQDIEGMGLNKYTLTHSDETTEEVKLDFNPTEITQEGTPINSDLINPIIEDLNACTDNVSTIITNMGGLTFARKTRAEYNTLPSSEKVAGHIFFVREN